MSNIICDDEKLPLIILDDIHSLISEIFQPLDKESMCSCVDILCALCMTDTR